MSTPHEIGNSESAMKSDRSVMPHLDRDGRRDQKEKGLATARLHCGARPLDIYYRRIW
jgi:hypothetical protein